MTDYDPFIDQQGVQGILSAFRSFKKIPHALIFSGIEGVGKRSAARYFAQSLNCSAQDPGAGDKAKSHGGSLAAVSAAHGSCGRCRACRLIASDRHPDIVFVAPSGRFMRIDQIRLLGQSLALKPYQAAFRVVILCDAHRMTPPAANALLKVLEEPPERTILVLITDCKSDLLPTVVSRCQQVAFKPLSTQHVTRLLVETHGAASEAAAVVAAAAGGSWTRAQQMLQENWPAFRDGLVADIEDLGHRGPEYALSLAERLCVDKERLPDALAVIHSWFRDVLATKYAAEHLIHPDMGAAAERAAAHRSAPTLLACLDHVQHAQRTLQAQPNVNARLVLEVMMRGLQRSLQLTNENLRADLL